MASRILIISDAQIDPSLCASLTERRFEVLVEADSEHALMRADELACDLLLIHVSEPAVAVELVKKVRSKAALRKTFILVVAEWGTGHPTLALTAGADAFEPAPIDVPRLVATVERLFQPQMAMTAKASPNGHGRRLD
jgi:DNA-binding response OmpR family regulator